MPAPYPRPFSYTEAVRECQKSICEDFTCQRKAVSAAMAFALSLAYNKSVAEVHADLIKDA